MTSYYVFLDYFIHEVVPRIIEIIERPILQKDILWIIAPLLITLLLIQVYFGRYKNEQIGWNTAFSNSISFLWVTTTLMRYLYENSREGIFQVINFQFDKSLLIIALGLWAVISIILQFYHALPKKLDFLIYSPLTVHITSILVVILVTGNILIDLTTLYSSLIIFISFVVIFYIIRHKIRSPKEVEISLAIRKRHKDEETKRKIKELKNRIKDKENKLENWIKEIKGKINKFIEYVSFWNK
ncbi:hypothetical protein HYX16_00240 [Candidatus Woesearchaeota archaeon]|nr:hypothetical protein [Candidatus Woesearchaeota archaeon]